ncbi:hypothetical protein D9M68_996960 [compost metagenome]
MQRDRQFAAGADVEREAFVGDPACDLATEECLGCVVHLGIRAEGAGHVAATRAEVVLVDDEQRGAVLLGKFTDLDTREGHFTVVAARSVARPHLR